MRHPKGGGNRLSAGVPPTLKQLMTTEQHASFHGHRPWPVEDPDWYGRVPPDDEYWRRVQHIMRHGLLCKVQLWVNSRNQESRSPLIGLKVTPLEQAPTNAPADHTGTWHISVAKHNYSRYSPQLEAAFGKRYKEPRILRLWFSRIGNNAVSYLDRYKDPIATDPVVQDLHRWGYPDDPMGLHVTF